MNPCAVVVSLMFAITVSVSTVFAADTITVALTAKPFQYTPLVIAQERGYLKEEGIDLKITYMQAGPSLQR